MSALEGKKQLPYVQKDLESTKIKFLWHMWKLWLASSVPLFRLLDQKLLYAKDPLGVLWLQFWMRKVSLLLSFDPFSVVISFERTFIKFCSIDAHIIQWFFLPLLSWIFSDAIYSISSKSVPIYFHQSGTFTGKLESKGSWFFFPAWRNLRWVPNERFINIPWCYFLLSATEFLFYFYM